MGAAEASTFRRLLTCALGAAAVTAVALAPGTRTVAADVSGAIGGIHTAAGVAPTDAAGLRPAVRLAHRDTSAVAGPVPVPVNVSTCRRDIAGAAMTLTIESVAYSCPVHRGGQATMDAGAVTMITRQGPTLLLAEQPGGAGTLWIAAHRVSHGGAFAAVPTLAEGALVTVSDDTRTAMYRVVARVRVEVRNDLVVDSSGHATGAATLDAIVRAGGRDDTTPRLVLQTCEGVSARWMIYADLVG